MFIRIFLLVLVEIIIDFESVRGQNDPRTICRDLLPQIVKIPIPPPGVTVKSPTSWIVAKTTKMKQPYPSDFNENVNTCRPQIYGPKCVGIQYLRVPDENGNGFTTHTYADHQTATENYAHFEDYFESKDPEYQMYEGSFKNMELVVDEIQPGTPVETIPDFVKNDHGGKILAVVDMPADGRWLILTTCDKKFTMVVLNWQYPITDSPQSIMARSHVKINEKLVKLGIDLSTMRDLPLDSFKFKMYEAIYGKNRTRSRAGEASTSGGGSASMKEETSAEDPTTPSHSISKSSEPSTSGGREVDVEAPGHTTPHSHREDTIVEEGSGRKLES